MGGTDWTNLPKEHDLAKFAAELPSILETTGHDEMYGVTLKGFSEGTPAPHTTLIVLQKFLRANANDVAKAKAQLTEALKWRKRYKPLEAKAEAFDASKFGGLGYVTTIKGVKDTKNEEDVATFNVYGVAAKDPKKAFGDTDAFVRWRVALMEITLAELKLDEADKPIPDYEQGPDPYQAIQIHDYLSVSFFRQPAEIKASSSKIIDMFQRYYPETVSYKYFVNVPLIMQWMMGAMKALISKDSIQKMTWMTYGNQLNQHLGNDIPKEYGGNGVPLKDRALTTKYAEPGKGKQSNGVEKTGVDGSPSGAEPAKGVDGAADAETSDTPGKAPQVDRATDSQPVTESETAGATDEKAADTIDTAAKPEATA